MGNRISKGKCGCLPILQDPHMDETGDLLHSGRKSLAKMESEARLGCPNRRCHMSPSSRTERACVSRALPLLEWKG